jgi:hypothetical protein
MKRFATVLTVSVTMAAAAFADNPIADPELETGIGVPFDPMDWVSVVTNVGDAVWDEDFCGAPTYDAYSDGNLPVIWGCKAIMTNNIADASSYIQYADMVSWNDLEEFQMEFSYHAAPNCGTPGMFVLDSPAVAVPADFTQVAGLAILFNATSSTDAVVSVYDHGVLVATSPMSGYNADQFLSMSITYSEDRLVVSRRQYIPSPAVFEIINTEFVSDFSQGYFGFGAETTGCASYTWLDSICLHINDATIFAQADNVTSGFALGQNYPNPFNPVTTIPYVVSETQVVSLKVYDLSGAEITTLVEGLSAPGAHSVSFDASTLGSGVYFYSLVGENFTETQKMILVK